MTLAIVLGVVVGVVGFLPLFGAVHLAKRATSTSSFGHAGALLLGVFGSFLFLAVALIICVINARDVVLPFTLSLAISLVVATAAYGVYKLVRK